jgi:hypothetical protein
MMSAETIEQQEYIDRLKRDRDDLLAQNRHLYKQISTLRTPAGICNALVSCRVQARLEGADMDAAKLDQAIALIKQASGLTDEVSGAEVGERE